MTNVDIFAENGKYKVIIDTKYKKFETLKDVSNSDIYQVTTYCLLHGATRGILLYPKWKNDNKEDNNDKKEPYILNTEKNDSIINIDFKTIDLKKENLKQYFKDKSKIRAFVDNLLPQTL